MVAEEHLPDDEQRPAIADDSHGVDLSRREILDRDVQLRAVGRRAALREAAHGRAVGPRVGAHEVAALRRPSVGPYPTEGAFIL